MFVFTQKTTDLLKGFLLAAKNVVKSRHLVLKTMTCHFSIAEKFEPEVIQLFWPTTIWFSWEPIKKVLLASLEAIELAGQELAGK